jgi:hypothetical protein
MGDGESLRGPGPSAVDFVLAFGGPSGASEAFPPPCPWPWLGP